MQWGELISNLPQQSRCKTILILLVINKYHRLFNKENVNIYTINKIAAAKM